MSQPTSSPEIKPIDWLSRYAGDYHRWRILDDGSRARPLGAVELAFDGDGVLFEGRADTLAQLTLEATSSVSAEDFAKRVTLAWTLLRTHHGLLRTKVVNGDELSSSAGLIRTERHFVVTRPGKVASMVEEAKHNMVFVEEKYPDVDVDVFCRHLMNTSRAIDPSSSLSRLFVLPARSLENGRYQVDFVFIVAHEITDGLTVYNQNSHFLRLLNRSMADLELDLQHASLDTDRLLTALPPAQESLYPPLTGSTARQRWAWAISRVLRHVRTPPPASIQNPLRRAQALAAGAQHMPRLFPAILNYDKTPPLTSGRGHVKLSGRASSRVIDLCRQIQVSIGAGCFTLIAMSMMAIYEQDNKSNALTSAIPLTFSFPINPRPFFQDPKNVPIDSLMLVFSDGITLPFLPSHLPLDARFRLLARQAQRQLSVLQKKPRTAKQTREFGLGSRSPGQLLPGNYLSIVERAESMLPASQRKRSSDGKSFPGLQGAYPVRKASTGATCGVSSIGDRRRFLTPGMFDLDRADGGGFAADFREMRASVRVRDGEFLVGSAGDDEGLHFGVSYDGNAISENKVQMWEKVMYNMFENSKAGLSREELPRKPRNSAGLSKI
jgi:hypothetical protein